MSLVFRRPKGGVLKLDDDALATLRRYRQVRSSATEAGGVLLGRVLLGGMNIVVDRVTTPARRDGRTRTQFLRTQRAHQRQIDRAWEESDGSCLYLGEWHTHPENDPQPSQVDKFDWRRRLKEDQVDLSAVWFVIIGIDRIRVWEGTKRDAEIVAMKESP